MNKYVYIIIPFCLVAFSFSSQKGIPSVQDKYCISNADLMASSRERVSNWFNSNYGYIDMDKLRRDNPRSWRKVNLIKRAAPVCVYMYLAYGGCKPSVKLAQAGVESSWGHSKLSVDHNNYFGIKNHKGGGANMQTKEFYQGSMVTQRSNFRKYDSLFDSFRDHHSKLDSKRYNAIRYIDDPISQIVEIKSSGYATDPNYVKKITPIIKELVSLDEVAQSIDNYYRMCNE